MLKVRLAGIVLLSLALAGAARAAVEVPGLFSDHMVLQQGRKVPVWGRAGAGEEVAVEFAGQKKITTADHEGRWRVVLDPLTASAEGRELVIRGANTITLNDVMVGEVWLCAGQSNMAMALSEADHAKEEMQKSDPLLRAFRVPERPGERPWTTVKGDWTEFSPKSATRWSALPYFFGEHLRNALQVPVGLIVCAWGGSSAVSWMSPEALRGLGPLVPEEIIGWRSNIQPSRLYHGMLYPLAPFGVAGVIWYQGETDGEPSMNAFLYRQLFPTLITDWRVLWNRPDLPFYWVQLPNLRNKTVWPVVRESQTAALTLPATGMIPTLDIGQEKNLHPTNKREFGTRLGNLVLAKSYQQDTWPGAPVFDRIKIEGDVIRISLREAKGLTTADKQPPKSFLVATEDGKFHPAEARIEGETLVISAASVTKPVAVRYAWDGNPTVNVVSAANLPLLPFRTDAWAVEAQQRHWESLPRKSALATRTNGGQLARAEDPAWLLELRGIDTADIGKFHVLRKEASFCQIALPGDRRGGMTLDSPALFWTTGREAAPSIDSAKGVTAEVTLQMYRATDPFRGFDLEVGLKQSDGKFRRYRISVVPMRLFAFQKKETHLLVSNLDNSAEPHIYRLAIRPDGVAQVYFDGRPVGLFEGEALDMDPPAKAYIRVGKQVESGEFTANFYQAAFDASGAFAP